MEKKQVEILAPAGSWGSLKAAVAAGADAVYMGGARFGARAYADNPDEKGLLEAIDYVHLHGRSLYMTVNTLFKESELGELEDYMQPYYERGLDGVIVQDLGALRLMKSRFPGLDMHASTQMTVTSVYGARMLKELGCTRVVTSREMSLDEIRQIHGQVDVEIESFVHGALCYCYSGQCLMSSLIGGRSGNRGRCAQPCRLPYRVYGADAASRQTPLNKDSEKHVLSLKDLCTLDILPDIIESGVYSLKIEGRMKSPRYTAGVVSIYRRYVDRYLEHGREGYRVEAEDRQALLDLFDRGGFTSGYYSKHNGRDMVALKEKPEFREGNQKLFDYLDRTYVETEPKEPVSGHAVLEAGVPSVLTLRSGEAEITVRGQAPETAMKQPMTEEKVKKQLNKTGSTPFSFDSLDVEVKGDLFLPVQALNELRRAGLEAMQEAILRQRRRNTAGEGMMEAGYSPGHTAPAEDISPAETASSEENPSPAGTASPAETALLPGLTVSIEEPEQFGPVLEQDEVSAVYVDADGFSPSTWKETADRCHKAGKECYLTLPQIFRNHAMRYFRDNRKALEQAGFDGVVVRALEEIRWLKDAGLSLPIITDASVYAWNTEAAGELAAAGAGVITIPWELNSREMGPVLDACRRLRVPSELIVYGHAPMMVSAQCITKTVKSCTRRREMLMMKDRTGAMLPVKNHCGFCYNTIYNPSPVSLLGSEDVIRRLNPGRISVRFTVEDRNRTEKVLDVFVRAFLHGETAQPPFKDFTRGHFKRGVE